MAPRKRKHPKQASPVIQVRNVTRLNQLLLFVQAGGICEFDGCNRYLLRHHLTLTQGNFGQMAHIVAFKKAGPRGDVSDRPTDINDVKNLMLLCPACHKLVDDHPELYSRRTLEEYKKRHERRIRYVTSLGPDRTTTVLVLKSRIGGHIVQVPLSQIVEATAPLYPSSSEPTEIDLSSINDTGDGFLTAAAQEIVDRVTRFLYPGGDGHTAQHISVFALAPIPLLVLLGSRLTNKVPFDVFQRHRDTENWTWKRKGTPVDYAIRLRKRAKKNKVALMLSLSGTIPLLQLPDAVRKTATIYEITLKHAVPATTFLKVRQDLENFRVAYQKVIGTILKNHGLIGAIDLFPAVPAPIAVLCGRELLPKVHPRLRVHDYNKNSGGFTFALEV